MNKTFLFIAILMLQYALAETSLANQIRIVSTANVHGETDPCG